MLFERYIVDHMFSVEIHENEDELFVVNKLDKQARREYWIHWTKREKLISGDQFENVLINRKIHLRNINRMTMMICRLRRTNEKMCVYCTYVYFENFSGQRGNLAISDRTWDVARCNQLSLNMKNPFIIDWFQWRKKYFSSKIFFEEFFSLTNYFSKLFW